MQVYKGFDFGFIHCPHCGKPSEFLRGMSEAHVICSDHNCWGGMSCHWGTSDNPEIFIDKMKNDWNKRIPISTPLRNAINAMEVYRNMIAEQTNIPDADYWESHIEVIDEVISKARLFVKD